MHQVERGRASLCEEVSLAAMGVLCSGPRRGDCSGQFRSWPGGTKHRSECPLVHSMDLGATHEAALSLAHSSPSEPGLTLGSVLAWGGLSMEVSPQQQGGRGKAPAS